MEKDKNYEGLNKTEGGQSILNETQKNAYKKLAEICTNLNSRKNEIIAFIDDLKNYNKDSEYSTTLNYVIEFLEENEISFILRLDWKSGIEDLAWVLKSSLSDNYNLTIELPEVGDYEEDASVSFDNVFEDFDQPLREQGLQMGFIDTKSDEYIIVLHRISEKEKIKNIIEEIGYKYYEVW